VFRALFECVFFADERSRRRRESFPRVPVLQKVCDFFQAIVRVRVGFNFSVREKFAQVFLLGAKLKRSASGHFKNARIYAKLALLVVRIERNFTTRINFREFGGREFFAFRNAFCERRKRHRIQIFKRSENAKIKFPERRFRDFFQKGKPSRMWRTDEGNIDVAGTFSWIKNAQICTKRQIFGTRNKRDIGRLKNKIFRVIVENFDVRF